MKIPKFDMKFVDLSITKLSTLDWTLDNNATSKMDCEFELPHACYRAQSKYNDYALFIYTDHNYRVGFAIYRDSMTAKKSYVIYKNAFNSLDDAIEHIKCFLKQKKVTLILNDNPVDF